MHVHHEEMPTRPTIEVITDHDEVHITIECPPHVHKENLIIDVSEFWTQVKWPGFSRTIGHYRVERDHRHNHAHLNPRSNTLTIDLVIKDD